MDEDELKRNPVLKEYIAQDLHVDPKLPFEDIVFDVITNVQSQYGVWTSDDADHVLIVGAYFHYARGFESPKVVDVTPDPDQSVPM